MVLCVWDTFGNVDTWMLESHAKNIEVHELSVRRISLDMWVVDVVYKPGYLYMSNTKEKADEVLNFIKDTEILFI